MEAKTHRNKIGARHLTKEEAKLILPTYDQIFEQVGQFRREKIDYGGNKESGEDSKKQDIDVDQKTNNIGIIGVRGAGKTSVLKTIRKRLKEENSHKETEKKTNKSEDIVLPIIVPENMSESSTLMATILGMLSYYIKDNNRQENGWPSRRDEDCIRLKECEEKYDEVIKQYTYIQKEYRDILLHEYTTENDYVDKSAEVFNSDTVFIRKFNQLIDMMVNKGTDNDRLLFIFIDDIDLSTYRCADVVKTLLSYLSNRNIVTFISGDLETFEEALTLDFLRQEQVLDADMLEQKVGNKKLLDSKQKLAYEYLKKILPPVFRHNIKHWSLEEKGNYRVSDSEEGGEGRTLSQLLKTALEGWIDPAYFSYAEVKNSRKIEEEGEITYQEQALPYTFHLFDDTSRGLNNVYNVLLDIAEKREKDDTSVFMEKKLLLDTIISSNPIYNRYRDKIQQNMFVVGTRNKECSVFFDNADATIRLIAEPSERFSLFLLVDFAARLLYEQRYADIVQQEFYRELKQRAMQDLYTNPAIGGRVIDISDGLKRIIKEELTENTQNYITLLSLSHSFLIKGDLVLNLSYYKNLPLNEMLDMYAEEEGGYRYSVELEQKVMIAVWKALASIAKVNNGREVSKQAAEVYPVFWREFAYIQSKLSSSAAQNIVMRLFEEEGDKLIGEKTDNGDANKEEYERMAGEILAWAKERQENALKVYTTDNLQIQELMKEEKKRLLLNTMAYLLKDDRNEIQKEWVKMDYVEEEKKTGVKNMEKRVNILKAIESGKLWQEEVAERAVVYIVGEIQRRFKSINSGLSSLSPETAKKAKTEATVESWEMYDRSKFGVSSTVAKRIKNEIYNILGEPKKAFTEGLSFIDYYKVMDRFRYLAENNFVWYGQSEAKKVMNALQEAYVECDAESPYTIFLLQCLYKKKAMMDLTKDSVPDASLLVRIRKDLAAAHTDADKQAVNDFIEKLKWELKTDISIDDYEKLFSSDNKRTEDKR